ncbi:MAG: hypothetical protein LBV72_15730 [Tannerella sp.]|jgi:hypothetical protein|nr:hypothetical protein [Tannerella sp.]
MERHVVANTRNNGVTKSLLVFLHPLEDVDNKRYSGVGENPSTPTIEESSYILM